MRSTFFIALASMALLTPAAHGQIMLNQREDFKDGTLMGWTNGLGAGDPVNQPNGGPLGAGDRYLEVSSGGLGGGPRIVVFNRSQWTGNYTAAPAAPVGAIAIDLKNFSSSTLNM